MVVLQAWISRSVVSAALPTACWRRDDVRVASCAMAASVRPAMAGCLRRKYPTAASRSTSLLADTPVRKIVSSTFMPRCGAVALTSSSTAALDVDNKSQVLPACRCSVIEAPSVAVFPVPGGPHNTCTASACIRTTAVRCSRLSRAPWAWTRCRIASSPR